MSTSPSSCSCTKCGKTYLTETLRGLCPQCLFEAACAPGPQEPSSGEVPLGGSPSTPYPRVFGDYVLLSEIGKGGMGVVYRARQQKLNRIVAVKMIGTGLFASEATVLRFQREAAAVARLDHPNIIPIYEFGNQEGNHFFSMKFVEGGSLADQIRARGWNPSEKNPRTQQEAIARLVSKIARAAHYMHQRLMLHRDLKPANVLMAPDHEPMLSDFGLTKNLDDDPGLTATGAMLGTPAYMAPEATDPGQITTASDTYSIGAILYELLTGQPPFQGSRILEEIRVKEPARPQMLNRFVDRDLETICVKAMEKEPRRRYSSSEALAEDLERWLRREPIAARRSNIMERMFKRVRRHPTQAGLILASLLVVGGAGYGVAWRSHQRATLQRASNDKELRAVDSLFDQNDTAAALQRLGGFLRAQPDYAPAAVRFLAVLGQRSFALPSGALPHRNEVLSAHFHPQGRLLVTASRDPIARIWDTVTSQVVIELRGHEALVLCARFSPDGTKVVTGSEDRTARLWDAATGRELKSLSGHEALVRQAGFNAAGSRVLTVASNVVRTWNAETGALESRLAVGEGVVRSAAFSPDGARFGTGGQDGMVRLWDAATGGLLSPPIQCESSVRSIRFSPDGSRLAVACEDHLARLWTPGTGTLIQLPHPAGVASAEFSPDGRWVVTACADGRARQWDQSGTALPFSLPHDQPVTSAQFSPDGRSVLTSGDDGTARLWDAETGKPLAEPIRHPRYVDSAEFSPDGLRVATCSSDNSVRLWQVPVPAPPLKPLPHLEGIQLFEFTPDGQLALTASNHVLRWWQVEAARPLEPAQPLAGAPTQLQFSADGRHLLFVMGSAVILRRGSPGPSDFVRIECDTQVDSANLSPDGNWIVTVSGREARTWDVRTRTGGTRRFTHSDTIEAAHFSPDGRWLLTAGRDNAARLWDLRTGGGLSLHHGGAVLAAAFSPDGKRVATASADQTASVWDSRTGAPVFRGIRHEAGVNSVAFSPEGARLVTASADRKLRIWDATTGFPLSDALLTQEPAWGARFAADGRHVLTRTGVAWEVPSAPASAPGWLAELAEALSGERRTTTASEQVEAGEFFRLARLLHGDPSSDVCLLWARWFLSDPWTRTVSPSSRIGLPEYANRRLAEGTLEGLREAVRFSPTNRLAKERLAGLLSAQGPR